MKYFFIIIVSLLVLSACNNQKEDENSLKAELNIILDDWHRSAAVADEDFFFGSMDSTAIYLGTDPGERWKKEEFMEWGMKYFQRDTAWVFKPYNRFWEFSDDCKIAWFDELLETHMGICRGSGVLIKSENQWKIKQYNLALTLPNEQMNEFREIQDIPIK
jgi:hypothetical protein